jgi:hypothetical protein
MTSTMLPRMATDRFATGLAIAAALIATLCISTATTTQAQQSAQPRCPAGYWLLEPVCLNQTTGDVVNAEPLSVFRISLEAGCAPILAPGRRLPELGNRRRHTCVPHNRALQRCPRVLALA